MARLILLLIALLLTACAPSAPAYNAVTPIMREIGPEEAGQIVLDATSTARVQATEVAQVTAASRAAMATSTAAYQATRDSLAVAQTQNAGALTQAAGLAAATDAAAVRTQRAGETQAAASSTARSVVAAAVATGTALARADQQAAVHAERESLWGDAWLWIRVCAVALFVLGAVLALVFGLSDLLSAHAEVLRSRARRESAEAQQLTVMQYAGYMLRLNSQQGWEVLHAPALPPGPASGAVLEQASPVREVPVKVQGEIVSAIPVGLPETPERARVLQLLTQAAAIAGPTADYIPSADQLGIHPQDWQAAVNLLKPAYVVATPGRPKTGQRGRTRLVHAGYRSLGALLDGVKRGDVLPRESPSLLQAGSGDGAGKHSESSF